MIYISLVSPNIFPYSCAIKHPIPIYEANLDAIKTKYLIYRWQHRHLILHSAQTMCEEFPEKYYSGYWIELPF